VVPVAPPPSDNKLSLSGLSFRSDYPDSPPGDPLAFFTSPAFLFALVDLVDDVRFQLSPLLRDRNLSRQPPMLLFRFRLRLTPPFYALALAAPAATPLLNSPSSQRAPLPHLDTKVILPLLSSQVAESAALSPSPRYIMSRVLVPPSPKQTI